MQPCSCQHVSKSRKLCGCLADPNGLHAAQCKVGGAPYAAHAEGCHILLGAVTAAGFQGLREQIVPELARPGLLSPQLDIEGWGLMGQDRLLIDFTLRHPLASRYSSVPAATSTAASEKQDHYGRTQGLTVRTAALEVYGRHGEELRTLLDYLADLSRHRERSLGLPPSRWLKKWRAQLSSMTAHFLGRAIQQARSGPMPAT